MISMAGNLLNVKYCLPFMHLTKKFKHGKKLFENEINRRAVLAQATEILTMGLPIMCIYSCQVPRQGLGVKGKEITVYIFGRIKV